MIVIIGALIVIGSVLGGFLWEGGHVAALLHPSELLMIGGSALGAMVIMSPKKVLVELVKQSLHTLKGAPYNRSAYEDLLKVVPVGRVLAPPLMRITPDRSALILSPERGESQT